MDKSPKAEGLAVRSHNLYLQNWCCSVSNCTHVHFRCQNLLVIDSPDASWVKNKFNEVIWLNLLSRICTWLSIQYWWFCGQISWPSQIWHANNDWDAITLVTRWLKTFSQQLHKCRPQNCWCFLQLMPSSMGFKNLFMSPFILYQTTLHLNWILGWQELTGNLVTTFANLMIPHTIHVLTEHLSHSVGSTNWLWRSSRRLCGWPFDQEGSWMLIQRPTRPLQNSLCTKGNIHGQSDSNRPSITSGSPQKVDFMAQYKKQAPSLVDEVEKYFKLLQENFDNCDPIQWWAGWHAQFPHLSQLAWDILAIPGKPTSDGALY